MGRIGAVQRRQREAGSWIIDEEPLGEGDGWQDWPAFHKVATTEPGEDPVPGHRARRRRRRARGQRRIAEHEYRVMSRLAAERAAPADGPGRERSRRRPGLPARRALPAARPLAGRPAPRRSSPRTALGPAAGRGGGLATRTATGSCTAASPRTRSGFVAARTTGLRAFRSGTGRAPARPRAPRLHGQIGGRAPAWPSDARPARVIPDGDGGSTPRPGRRRPAAGRGVPGARGRLVSRMRTGSGSTSSRSGRCATTSWPAGRPPDRAALRERLRRADGLDLAAGPAAGTPGVRALVLDATRPSVTDRLADVRAFLAKLTTPSRPAPPPTRPR